MGDDLLGRPVVTAEDLDGMTPQQADDAWRASIITDPAALPADYIEAIRHRAAARLARRDIPAAS